MVNLDYYNIMKNSEDFEGEIWVKHPIGIMVSNLGRVETKIKGKHYGYDNGNGYLRVNWKGKMYEVHVLIAEAFLPNEDNLPTVDHINRDKTDNRVENLRWADMKMQNKNREVDWKTRNAKIDWKAIAEKKSKPILQLNKNLEIVREWKSSHQAQRDGGFHQGNIIKCLKGNRKSHKGYIWQYKNG